MQRKEELSATELEHVSDTDPSYTGRERRYELQEGKRVMLSKRMLQNMEHEHQELTLDRDWPENPRLPEPSRALSTGDRLVIERARYEHEEPDGLRYYTDFDTPI